MRVEGEPMSFITPALALAGIAAMAVPIIIHLLFRRRRQPVRWAAMQFLLEAIKKHQRRLHLEQILLLAVRMLILCAFGAALARPLLDDGGLLDLGGSRTIYFVLDNGLSATVEDQQGQSAFQHHQDRAVDIVEHLDPGDRVSLVLAAQPSRAPLSSPSLDHRAVIDLLRSLKPTEAATDLDGALLLLHTLLDERDDDDQEAVVYLLSDFRAGSADLESTLPPAPGRINNAKTGNKIKNESGEGNSGGLNSGSGNSGGGGGVRYLAQSPAEELINNIQITAIEPLRRIVASASGEGIERITVRLKRTGETGENDVSRVRLLGDGLETTLEQVVSWERGQAEASVDFTIKVAAGHDGQLALTAILDDDSLLADNRRHVILEVRRQIRILLADRHGFGFAPGIDRLRAGQWMRRALAPVDTGMMDLTEADPAAFDSADTRGVDVVILPRPDLLKNEGWKLLREFVQTGGLLIITPPGELNVHPWTANLANELGLPWRLALEVDTPAKPLLLADEQPTSGVLRLLSSELQNLIRPVEIYRTLNLNPDDFRGTRLLNFTDGSPFIVMGSPQVSSSITEEENLNGREIPPASNAAGAVIYIATAPELEWTNLPTKPLLVPLMHEIVRQGISEIRASTRLIVGARSPITHLGGQPIGSMQDQDGNTIMIDENHQATEPLHHGGIYQLRDRMSRELGQIAVNVQPDASNTTRQSASAVESWLHASAPWSWIDEKDITGTAQQNQSNSPIAWIILWTVLALLLLETALARWFSHAQVRRASPSPHHTMTTGGRPGGRVRA